MKYYLLVIVAVAYLAYVHSSIEKRSPWQLLPKRVHLDACVQCNSKDTPTCATLPETMFARNCPNNTNSSRCYIRVLDGYTIRGCESELDNATLTRCNNELECVMCSFMDGCNRGIFPTHRATCIQCTSNSTNSSCATDVYARPHVCPIYKLGDKCFIRNTGKNGTEGSFSRGCLSSAHEKRVCKDERNCFTCEGAGCNNLNHDSFEIPVARDSASFVGYSLMLSVVGFVLARLS